MSNTEKPTIKGTYRLIPCIQDMQQVNVARKINGKTTFGVMRLYPDTIYELEDDQTLLDSLLAAKIEKKYSTALAAMLTENGVDFEELFCRSCGGRVKKLRYGIIEVKRQ